MFATKTTKQNFSRKNGLKSKVFTIYLLIYLANVKVLNPVRPQCARLRYQKDIYEKLSDSLLNVQEYFFVKILLNLVV